MTNDDSSPDSTTGLPDQRITKIAEPILQFLRIEAFGGIALFAAAAVALILANSRWAQPFLAFWDTPVGIRLGPVEIFHPVRDAINEGLMTLFFFTVGLEIKREAVLGELKDLRIAALPVAAAVGGMLVPAGLFLALQNGTPGEDGWGAVMATDIAFTVGCLALLGGRVPRALRVFVLSLAIIDDIGAVLVIAIGYASALDFSALGFGLLGIGCILGLRYLGVRSVPLYLIVGILSWFAVYQSGIHPTVVGVVLGLLTPAYPWVGAQRFLGIIRRARNYILREDRGHEGEAHSEEAAWLRSVSFAARETLSPLARLETALHPWVGFVIMPLFALANAGVPLTVAGFKNPVVLAVIAGLCLGKPIGIVSASWIAVRSGIALRPNELSWPLIAAAGVLCGIGFTMALFIAGLAFKGSLLVDATLGILAASVLSALVGMLLMLVILRRGQIRSGPR